MPSPLLLPHSPRETSQGTSTTPHTYKKRLPTINTGFAGPEAVARETTYSPTRLLPSTSTISLLSLSFSNANLEDSGVSIGSVLLEEPQPHTPQQAPQSPKQPLWRKAGHLTPTSSFTSAGQYLNSAQHRRVSHYITGIPGSPTSGSRRGSAANLPQLSGTTPNTPGAQTIPGQQQQSRSRRPSYTLQSPMQPQSPMYSHLVPPDSPPLGPVSLGSSPSRMFLAQTPPVSQFARWGTMPGNAGHPSNVIDIIQERAADEEETDDEDRQSETVKTTAAALKAALETELNNHSKASPIAIPLRHGEEPDSPELGPVMSPLGTAPMTPMALDLQSQQNSLQTSQGGYFGRRQLGTAPMVAPGEPEGVMHALNSQ